jgi:hypothetical protein
MYYSISGEETELQRFCATVEGGGDEIASEEAKLAQVFAREV